MAAKKDKSSLWPFIKYWLPVIICAGYIYYMSSLPAREIPSLFPFQEVLFHGIIYAVLGLLFLRAFKITVRDLDATGLVIVTVLFGLAYGILDEVHQMYVPGRCCSGFDILTDGIGSLIGAIAALLMNL